MYQLLWERGSEEFPLYGGCPFLGGSFIGGSTVAAVSYYAVIMWHGSASRQHKQALIYYLLMALA